MTHRRTADHQPRLPQGVGRVAEVDQEVGRVERLDQRPDQHRRAVREGRPQRLGHQENAISGCEHGAAP